MEGTITKEEFDNLKPEALVKLLGICQLSLQYFEYSQNYLNNLNNDTKEEVQKLEQKIKEDQEFLRESKKEIANLKEEVQIKKETLKKYQQKNKHKEVFKCHICEKLFVTEPLLD